MEENDENNITVSSSLLVPVRYELYEKDDVSDKSLEVKYYELELKFLSKMVRKELTEFWLNPDFNYYQLQSDVFDSAFVCEMNSSVEFYIENGSRVIYVDYRGDKTTEQLFEAIEQSLGEQQ